MSQEIPISAADDPVAAIVSVLTDAQSIAVAGHVGPDGDALGSMIAIARAARSAGKHAVATFGDPFVIPHQLRFLDTEVVIPVKDVDTDLDVLVVVDCGDRGRLGSAAELADRAKTVVVVDHHITNDGFGDVAWIDGTSAATAQMAFTLIERLGWEIDRPTAEALYAGIVTDTGRFQYSSTAPFTHSVAARLLEAGVAPAAIGQKLYEEAPFGYLQVAGAVLSRSVLDTDLKLVWSYLTSSDLAAAGVSYEQVDGLIDLIRIAEEAEAACLLRDLGNRRTKGSLRSRGRIDVGEIAVALGGGGHRNAAGFTVEGTHEEVIALVKASMGDLSEPLGG